MNFYKSLDSAIVLVIVNFGLEPKTNNYIEQTKTLSLAKPNQTRTKTNNRDFNYGGIQGRRPFCWVAGQTKPWPVWAQGLVWPATVGR